MSNQTKVLLVSTAIVAFVIGAALNSTRVNAVNSVEALLSAKLLNAQSQNETPMQHLGKVTLVNFWATWCSPCRREMPLFEAVYQREKDNGFQIIGIAIDNVGKAQPMLDSMGITYPILYAEKTGTELMESSGNPLGALPYSLLLDENGVVIDQKLGEIHEEHLMSWVQGKAYNQAKVAPASSGKSIVETNNTGTNQ